MTLNYSIWHGIILNDFSILTDFIDSVCQQCLYTIMGLIQTHKGRVK
jgi:hypothetical protein